MRGLAGVVVLLLATSSAHAEVARPRLELVPTQVDLGNIGTVVNSKTIFLNRCVGGCKLSPGNTDSRTNKSAIGSGTLSAFSFGDPSWNAVKACMVSTFSRFNVTITDVDPGASVEHFEVMVAGSPTQIGLPNGIGGVAEYPCQAPGSCQKYIPNTIAFAFAAVYAGMANRDLEICATAAQEIAHTFTLDHVFDPSDPLTYSPYSGMRQFKDNVECGSDCSGSPSKNAFGLTCTNQKHVCMSTGAATQNDVQTMLALFGPAGAKAPTLKLNNPTNNSTQPPAFSIDVDCTSTDQIQEVDLSIDGNMLGSLTAPPFKFMANALTDGPHKISVLCASKLQAISTATASVIVGRSCSDDAMCEAQSAGFICVNMACIAGPGAAGGLGADCTGNADCSSGTCASDGTTMACTIGCSLDQNNCPDGFGCLDSGGGNGVCWAGLDNGGGCCDTGGGNAGTILLSLGLAAALLTRRKRA